ncbi:MAG: hypothetical protein ABIH83_00185 [Candidatus Micrarchaeota archaeon]
MEKIRNHPSIEQFWIGEKLIDLSKYYPKLSNPEITQFVGGKILGAKGQFLFYQGPSGLHYGVNMNQKIGNFIMERKNGGLF